MEIDIVEESLDLKNALSSDIIRKKNVNDETD